MDAILELGANYNNGLLQIKDIAARRAIPRHYLEQLLNRLLKTGLIKSIRGNKGGYQLGREPAVITFLQVIEALDGKIALSEPWSVQEALHSVLFEAESEMKKIFNITLQDLIERENEMKKMLVYMI